MAISGRMKDTLPITSKKALVDLYAVILTAEMIRSLLLLQVLYGTRCFRKGCHSATTENLSARVLSLRMLPGQTCTSNISTTKQISKLQQRQRFTPCNLIAARH